MEAVYTIVHRVGRFSGIADDKLTQYVQQSFRFDDERHKRLLSRANEEKVCSFRRLRDRLQL